MKSDRTGIALVELMIAIAIAVVSFGAIFALAANSMRAIRDMRSDAIASRIAESEIERLRTLQWAGVLSNGAGFNLDSGRITAMAELGKAKGFVHIMPLDSNAAEILRCVSVRIEWKGCNGQPREIALATIMGPQPTEEHHDVTP